MRRVSSLRRTLSCSHRPAGRQSFDNRDGTTAGSAVATARSLWSGAHGVITLPKLFIHHRFSLISMHVFCHSRNVMRLLVEILIIAGLIYFGWNTPFKDHVAEANRTITNQLHSLGKGLQKHQDPSVRRY
jgi:hypothetical protein